MSMKLQIIGHQGSLGSALAVEAKRAGHTVITTQSHFPEINAPIVVNCAGIVKQRTDQPTSMVVYTNSVLPHLYSLSPDSKLIHISTDCVFDGNRNAPYDETQLPTPGDLYGRSKLAGEIYHGPHLTIRTSFVGFGKHGLLNRLRQQRGQRLRVSKFGQWTGHTTIALSRILLELAEKEVSGLLHIPAEAVTRGELIRKLSKAFDLDITVEETYESGIDRRLISRRWDSLEMSPLSTLDEEIEELCQSQSRL